MGGDGADGKGSIRARLTALRRALHPDDVQTRGARVQERLVAMPEFAQARTVALYASLPGEVPTDAVFAAARAAGKTVCFPVVPNSGRQLVYRAVTALDQLLPAGRLRIREPGSDRPAVGLDAIELFVVPGVAFTRAGHRLGRGGGYYDATLRTAPSGSRRIALAFSEQVVGALPVGDGDVPVDRVVTESETFPGPGREHL